MDLITQQDVLRMKFNSEGREINSVADYMRLYLKILQLAFEYDVITAEQRDAIAGSILTAIHKAANGNEVIISNYVYAITMRFMVLSNYECWMLMSKIKCQEDANNFVSETKAWFVERVSFDIDQAERAYKHSCQLRNLTIIETWEALIQSLKVMSGSLESGSEYNLKSKHGEVISVSKYSVMNEKNGVSCLDITESFIRSFAIETSILVKIDASAVIKAILKQRETRVENDSDEIEIAERECDEAKCELERLKAYYAERMKLARASEVVYNRIYDQFEEEHDYMDEDELAEAFEEHWLSCPEYFPDDVYTVEDEYRRMIISQESRISECEMRLEELHVKKESLKNVVDNEGDKVTLKDIIMEYAIAFLAQSGYVAYPNTHDERKMILSKIPCQMAVRIFIQNEADKITLTAEEYNYLIK